MKWVDNDVNNNDASGSYVAREDKDT